MPKKKQAPKSTTQRTEKSLEIPVPERKDFFRGLREAAKKPRKPSCRGHPAVSSSRS